MKTILTFIITCLIATTIQAQCPKDFKADDFNEIVEALDRYRPNLKEIRQWARINERSDIEKATNRLEYWSKDVKRYILKHKESHINKVCERVFKKEYKYFSDFLLLTIFYKKNPTSSDVNFKKYQ